LKYREREIQSIPAAFVPILLMFAAVCSLPGVRCLAAPPAPANIVDATSLHGKIMCGYQGWFRCPGDRANMGWVHWSRDSRRITPATLTFEMWPDMSEYSPSERFAAPGFIHANGQQAYLFSSDNAGTVLRHFQWMAQYGIDGAWLQHFVVDLPGGPSQNRYPSRLRVLHDVAEAANKTGRAWALCYDVSGTRSDQICEILTRNWKALVDGKMTDDPRYLHEGGKPVVQVWGFYANNKHSGMAPETAAKIIDFFHQPGKYSAYLVAGDDWNWRRNADPRWQAIYRNVNACAPWNVGNYSTDSAGIKHASTAGWAQDKKECESHHQLWMPVVYPGFSWDNLQRKPPGSSTVPRRKGQFLWEQFHALSALKPDSVYIAMFDEVDEGTAIFKVTSDPPTQAHFVGYEDMPSDWYLRLVREAGGRLREGRPIPPQIPIQP